MKTDWSAIAAAEHAVNHVDPEASDQAIAEVVADYLLAMFRRSRTYRLSIMHDVRPSASRRVERWRKHLPDHQPVEPTGPCPLAYDWHRKNIVGISTRDRDRARQWAIEASLAGYCVYRDWSSQGGGSGRGSIEHIRKRRRDELAALP